MVWKRVSCAERGELEAERRGGVHGFPLSTFHAERVAFLAAPTTLDAGAALNHRRKTMNPPSPTGCCPPASATADLRPVEGREADEELATLAKALGHPVRVQILRLLIQKTSCICGDIVGELPLAQSTVSQHLKVLKEAGLIRGEVDGPRVCYCIEPRTLRRFRALVGGL